MERPYFCPPTITDIFAADVGPGRADGFSAVDVGAHVSSPTRAQRRGFALCPRSKFARHSPAADRRRHLANNPVASTVQPSPHRDAARRLALLIRTLLPSGRRTSKHRPTLDKTG
jgi:hypothetical protein